MTDFTRLLDTFVACVQANDGAGFAALFTPEATYEDGFFGAHTGRANIAAMLSRFHAGGEQYRWEFHEPLSDGRTGYARYRFSYRAKLPESAGRPIAFEGIARMLFSDGLIKHYAETFDRGVAFVQLGFPAGKTARLLEKYAATQNAAAEVQPHLARFGVGAKIRV
ncbi:MAG: nuclear transport factor 2 family protein [Betaproteobacteria bacterium]|nr:nuclear transport factor 2 family protein [Betaproteobacteria bacterium]